MFVLFADSYEHAGMMPINTIVSIPMRSLVVFGQRDEGGSVTLAFNLRRGDIILGLFPGPGVIEAVAFDGEGGSVASFFEGHCSFFVPRIKETGVFDRIRLDWELELLDQFVAPATR